MTDRPLRRFRETVLPGIHRLSLPYRNVSVNVYLVVGDGARLVDTGDGSPEAARQLHWHLADLGIQISELREILLTHTHPDHVGMAEQLAAESGARVLVHEAEARAAAVGTGSVVDFDWLEEHGLSPAARDHFRPTWRTPPGAEILRDGDILPFGPLSLEILATPGHSPGLVCAYDRAKSLIFSSDQLMRVPSPITLLDRRDGDPIGRYLQGLDRLAPLEVSTALPGHGRRVSDWGLALARAAEFHVRRADVVERRRAAGGASVKELAAELEPAIDGAGPVGVEVLEIGRVLAVIRHLEHRAAARTGG